ncbi:MAG: PEP/pyruvate-binding domain-containing protein, partial [Actinomycetota bacterium]
AALLDRAARAGLPVPDGVVILGTTLAEASRAAITSTISGDDRRLAVRSAFASEDGDEQSRAGWFATELSVEPADVVEAIQRVRASAERHDRRVRPDVLVMAMVDARLAGVAFSETGTYDDLLNVTDGLGDQLVSGAVEGDRLLLPRLEIEPDGWRRRLQALLADVRGDFGDLDWDVEWADDGAVCWLLQVRPITARPRRDELLTLANHAEILPELPSALMTSTIAGAGPDLFAWYRRRVPGLPVDRDFLHVVAGRPMINLSLLEDMMRHLGLPTALVADSIGGRAGAERPAAPGRIIRRSPSLARLGWAQIAAVARSERNRRRVAAIGENGARSFGEALDQLHEAYVTLVTGMFPLSSAIGPPLALLRRSGTLAAHAASHRTITTELSLRLGELQRAPVDDRPRLLQAFLADFGHRGVYESDISRPRFADEPDLLVGDDVSADPADGAGAFGSLSGPATIAGRRGLRWWITRPVWLLVSRPITARERFRHEAMRSFASIRASLVELADHAHTAGLLPSRDDLWALDVETVRALDQGVAVSADHVAEIAATRERLASLRPPHVVSRFDDPESWSSQDSGVDGSEPHRWSGLPLTQGRVEGRAWVLSEPGEGPPEGDGHATVLIARSIDAGWVSTLQRVSAVAVEIGGDLSHGSILVRELGLPAVTNVRGVLDGIATGDLVALDADVGTVRRYPAGD